LKLSVAGDSIKHVVFKDIDATFSHLVYLSNKHILGVGTCKLDSNHYQVCAIEVDENLNRIKKRMFGFMNSYPETHQVKKLKDGSFVLLGYTWPSGGNKKITLYNLNSVGDSTSMQVINNGNGQDPSSMSVLNNEYFISFYDDSLGDNHLMKYNPLTNKVDTIIYDYQFRFRYNSSIELSDTSFAVLGRSRDQNTGERDLSVDFYKADLTHYFTNTFGRKDTIEFENTTSSITANDSLVFMSGTSNIDFGNLNFSTQNINYIVKCITKKGDKKWLRFYGKTDYNHLDNIIATKDGGCLLLGSRYSATKGTGQEHDVYVVKVNQDGNTIDAIYENEVASIPLFFYPNPANTFITFKGTTFSGKCKMGIYNLLGEKVFEENILNLDNQNQVELPYLPDGFYMVQLQGATKIGTSKLIIAH
jgi:hypothetical protein